MKITDSGIFVSKTWHEKNCTIKSKIKPFETASLYGAVYYEITHNITNYVIHTTTQVDAFKIANLLDMAYHVGEFYNAIGYIEDE